MVNYQDYWELRKALVSLPPTFQVVSSFKNNPKTALLGTEYILREVSVIE